MTQPNPISDTTLQITRVFKAPRERVFRAFIDVDAMRSWFCPGGFSFENIAVDPATGRGSDFVMVHDATRARYAFRLNYTLVDSPNRIEWISVWGDGFSEPGREIRTLIEFSTVPDGTRVTLRQHGFTSRTSRDDHGQGWNEGLDKLAGFLAATLVS
jgi:glutathione S-transferase